MGVTNGNPVVQKGVVHPTLALIPCCGRDVLRYTVFWLKRVMYAFTTENPFFGKKYLKLVQGGILGALKGLAF